MPTYDFNCSSCDINFEKYQTFLEYDKDKKEDCPLCTSNEFTKRLPTVPMHAWVKDVNTVGSVGEANYKRDEQKLKEEAHKEIEQKRAMLKEKHGSKISDTYGQKHEPSLDLSKIIPSDDVELIAQGNSSSISDTAKSNIKKFINE